MTVPEKLRKRILLVEDNSDDEILTLDVLRSGGVKSQIDVARDRAEAHDYVFRRGQFVPRDDAPPDLILLDLKLPNTEDEDLARSYAGGANSYIRKPVDFELFNAAVKSSGVYWLVYNQAPGQR
jgi:two-component system response regulator